VCGLSGIKSNYGSGQFSNTSDRQSFKFTERKKIFTSLDLKNGFYHVRVNENSIPYTSFVTSMGQYEYLKMPFGLTKSSRVFNRFIQLIFRELIKREELLVYLDDIMIATMTFSQHFDILKVVFRLAVKHDLQFRFDIIKYSII